MLLAAHRSYQRSTENMERKYWKCAPYKWNKPLQAIRLDAISESLILVVLVSTWSLILCMKCCSMWQHYKTALQFSTAHLSCEKWPIKALCCCFLLSNNNKKDKEQIRNKWTNSTTGHHRRQATSCSLQTAPGFHVTSSWFIELIYCSCSYSSVLQQGWTCDAEFKLFRIV